MPAISAVSDGYDAYVAVDASGSFSQTRPDTALLRLHHAGVIPVDFASAMIEILADNASPLAEDLYNAIDIPFAKLDTGLTPLPLTRPYVIFYCGIAGADLGFCRLVESGGDLRSWLRWLR